MAEFKRRTPHCCQFPINEEITLKSNIFYFHNTNENIKEKQFKETLGTQT